MMRRSIRCTVTTLLIAITTVLTFSVTDHAAAWRPIPPKQSSSSSVSSSPAPRSAEPKAKSEAGSIPILTYHYVENVKDKKDQGRIRMDITPQIFENQLKSLAERTMQTIFVREIPAILMGKVPRPAHPIALSFDDGYSDFYTDVFPLLKKYNVRATFYLVNTFIGKPGYVTDAQVNEFIASGLVEIGAHTMDHKNLTNMTLKKAEQEINESKTDLEKRYSIAVQTFAYPYGKHSPKVDALVENAGFTCALTTERGFLQSVDHLFQLKRVPSGAFLGSRKWKAIGENGK